MGRLVKIPASMGLPVNARGIFFKIVGGWVLGAGLEGFDFRGVLLYY